MALTQVQPGMLASDSQYTGFKNRIINGAMVIDQRNAGASVTPVNEQYTLDRWQAWRSQASKYSVQQKAGAVTPPSGFSSYLGVTSLTAYSIVASDYFMVSQKVEGLNVFDFAWGTASAQSVTLSFWVHSSLTGTFGGSVQNSAQNRSYPFTYTISVANTWEQKTVSISGDTSGTWLSTNGIGLYLWFGLGVASNFSGTAGSWSGNAYFSATGATSVVGTNGATFYITGVQLEKGSTATSFDYRPYGTELALCQRYFWKPVNTLSNISQGGKAIFIAINTSEAFGSNFFAVTMRAAPTITSYDNAGTSGAVHRLGVGDITGVTADEINASSWSRILKTSGLVATGVYGALFTASAEL